MKNILIINQPIRNRGDEAAHRSLMRELDKSFPDFNFTVLFLHENEKDINEIVVKSPRIKYCNIKSLTKGVGITQRLALSYNLLPLAFLRASIRQYANHIKEAQLILCAPGGICMGGFQSWTHIFGLLLAKKYKKKIIYYSRSFGPFPTKTKGNRIFKKISYELLNYFSFLSIRDKKTMKLADELNLTYIPTVDTAFLDNPAVEIPNEVSKIIGNEKFVVFVPNSLTWHPAYKTNNESEIMSFYIDIANLLLENGYKIVMLPQLYNAGKSSDYEYFEILRKLLNSKSVIVLKDTYSSDIQQNIIHKAELVIGARYHSIVFAINNQTPFVSLSYEHKMSGLLETLNLSDREIDITQIGTNHFHNRQNIKRIQDIIGKEYSLSKEIQNIAQQYANSTFEKLKEFIRQQNESGL